MESLQFIFEILLRRIFFGFPQIYINLDFKLNLPIKTNPLSNQKPTVMKTDPMAFSKWTYLVPEISAEPFYPPEIVCTSSEDGIYNGEDIDNP